MIFDPVLQAEWDKLQAQNQAPAPSSVAGLGTQLARGIGSGFTFGAWTPYSEEPPGGIPEELAKIVGYGLNYPFMLRGAKLGVMGAGKLFPSLLKPGVEAGQAAKSMLTSFRPTEALTERGNMLSHMGAMGVSANMPELLGGPPRTWGERIGETALGAGIGAAGEKIANRLRGYTSETERGIAAAKGKGPLTSAAQAKDSVSIKALDTEIALLKSKMARERPGSPHIDAYKADIVTLEKAKARLVANAELAGVPPDPQLELGRSFAPITPEFEMAGDLFEPISPTGGRSPIDAMKGFDPMTDAGGFTPPGMRGAPYTGPLPRIPSRDIITSYTGSLDRSETDQYLRNFGIRSNDMSDEMASAMLATKLRQQNGGLAKQTGLRAPESFPSQPVLDITNHSVIQKRLNDMGMGFAKEAAISDPIRTNNAVRNLWTGSIYQTPVADSLIGRALGDSMFMDIRLPYHCSTPCVPMDLPQILASGFSQSKLAKMLMAPFGRTDFSPLPPTTLLGMGVRSLPGIMQKAEGVVRRIIGDASEAMTNVRQWSPQTKEKVKNLMHLHGNDPALFQRAIESEAPEALQHLPELQKMMESIWVDLVKEGLIEPGEHMPVYFPVVRERLAARATGVLHLDAADGYVPVPVQNLIGPKFKFAQGRTLGISEETLPKSIGFDDTLRIYTNQYARAKAIREVWPELQQALAEVPEDMREYAAEVVNRWLGNPAFVSRTTPFGQFMRNFQFARTLGGSLLSPLVNTFQRLNTMAVVSTPSFLKAFEDMHDPSRLAMLARTELGDMLGKLDLDAGYASSGKLMQYSQKMADVLGKLFERSERNNRIHAFMAGLREAEVKGITDESARIAFATDVVNSTQFIQSRANFVPLFHGDIGRMMGQFQTFRLNQMHFMLRLVDEAKQGVMAGDFARTAPLLKYFGASAAIGGGGTMLWGDWGEEKITRHVLGQSIQIPGLAELLFGVTLQSQLGLGAVNLDDVRSMLFFLPGPSVGFAQALLGTVAGVDVGHGIDFTQLGRELTFQERASLAAQSMPAGLQLNRSLAALRLVQNDGHYRRAMDWREFAGFTPSSGELMSKNAATTEQILLAAAGLQNSGRLQEVRLLTRQKEMINDLMLAQERSADLVASGHTQDAQRVIDTFNHRYSDQLQTPLMWPTSESIKNALNRKNFPPGSRLRPPVPLRGAEPFNQLQGL